MKKKKEIIPLTIKESQSYHEQNICYICKEEFSIDNKDKKYQKIIDHCHYIGNYHNVIDHQRSLSLHWKTQRCCSQYL